MHACGHDGHTAIDIDIVWNIDKCGGFDGTLRLFFQPAEEGSRWEKAMNETNHVRTLDYILAPYLWLGLPTKVVVEGFTDPLPNVRLNVRFKGFRATPPTRHTRDGTHYSRRRPPSRTSTPFRAMLTGRRGSASANCTRRTRRTSSPGRPGSACRPPSLDLPTPSTAEYRREPW